MALEKHSNRPKLYDQIKTLVDVQADFKHQIIPKGAIGTIVECYEQPEGYAVDLAMPNENQIGGFSYENVILHPNQFELINRSQTLVDIKQD